MVGVNRGHCGLVVLPGAGGGPLRLHPCRLPELAISARFADAAVESEVRAGALLRRRELEPPGPPREPRFGVSRSLLHIPSLGLHPRPSEAELAVSPQRLIPTGASWLCPGTGSGARLAQSTAWGEPARPSCECTIRRHAAGLLVAPETAGWALVGRVPGQVGTFHFFNGSGEGQGNHWRSRLSPGSAAG